MRLIYAIFLCYVLFNLSCKKKETNNINYRLEECQQKVLKVKEVIALDSLIRVSNENSRGVTLMSDSVILNDTLTYII